MNGALGQIWQVFDRGGPVMWPLSALSVITLALIVERLIFWLGTHGPRRSAWVLDVADRLREGDEPGVRAIASTDRSVYSRIIKTLLANPPHEALSVELTERFRRVFERSSVWLSTTITAAPLLGILGSVSGIIRSLGLLGQGGHATDINAAAAGIAEALITTAFGLSIALVALFPYMFCRAQIERVLGAIELLSAAYQNGPHRVRPPRA